MKKMLTKELSNELKKREGIISITVEPYEKNRSWWNSCRWTSYYSN